MSEIYQIGKGLENLTDRVVNLEKMLSDATLKKSDGTSSKVIHVQNAEFVESGQTTDALGNKFEYKKWIFKPVQLENCEWTKHVVTVRSDGSCFSELEFKNHALITTKCFLTSMNVLNKQGHILYARFAPYDVKGRDTGSLVLGINGHAPLRDNFENLGNVSRYLVACNESKGELKESIPRSA